MKCVKVRIRAGVRITAEGEAEIEGEACNEDEIRQLVYYYSVLGESVWDIIKSGITSSIKDLIRRFRGSSQR